MELWELIILSLVGVVGGVLSGLVGVGGGVIFVPALVYVLGWDIQEAIAASLGIVIFSSISGVARGAFSEDPVSWRCAGILSLGGAPAALAGVAINHASPEEFVQLGFSVLLLRNCLKRGSNAMAR